jgi:hypothetical protein
MQRWKFLTAFLPAVLFPIAALVIGLKNPLIFRAPSLLRDNLLSAIIFTVAFGTAFFFSRRSVQLHENISGLVLFYLFSPGYFILASIFNKPDINTNNVYFAADNFSWLQRMAMENGWEIGTRAVHPFAHLIFRPVTTLLSTITGGDHFYANLIMLAIAGGGCVFLMWKIIKQISGDEIHAILFASLLGLSASHLIFASVIESYIFSTMFLLLFVWLLINDKDSYLLIATGVVTLGITITNTAQQGITALLVQRNLRRTATLLSFVILFGIGVNIISRLIYPVTEYFFIPQNLMGEQRFSQNITFERIGLMAENLFVYNIAAPQPYASIRRELPHFNFLNGTIWEYDWFGLPALILWLVILEFAFYSFFKNTRLTSTGTFLATSMLACLVFNFLLHIGYGVEPFLYTPDWTYAIVLFVAISLGGLVANNWFKIMLFVFVIAVFTNNLWFLYIIARKASEFFV